MGKALWGASKGKAAWGQQGRIEAAKGQLCLVPVEAQVVQALKIEEKEAGK